MRVGTIRLFIKPNPQYYTNQLWWHQTSSPALDQMLPKPLKHSKPDQTEQCTHFRKARIRPWKKFYWVVLGKGCPSIAPAIALGLILISLRKHPGILPAGGTCSAIISASCHRPKENKEAHLFPVQWGEVPEERHPYSEAVVDVIKSSADNAPAQRTNHEQQITYTRSGENFTSTERPQAQLIIGHCCFTTASSVKLPETGRRYA